jgi:hypothetical protein
MLIGLLVLVVFALLLWLGASGVIGKPPKAFVLTPPPPPDYAVPSAWLAFPGRNGQERSAPPGTAPIATRPCRA